MLRLPVASIILALMAAGTARAQVATAAPTYDGAPAKMTASEVATTFSGRHLEYGVDVAGHAWTMDVAADGNVGIRSGDWSDAGHMTIRGDQVCVAWRKAWSGSEKCFHYARHGAQYASYGPDGALNSTLTITR